MSVHFVETLGVLSLSAKDPEGLENFLLEAENQFKTVRLTNSELTSILDKISNDLIPELSHGLKMSGFDHEIVAKALSFFNGYLSEFSSVPAEHQWKSSLLAFALKCYKLSSVNKVKTVGLQIVQNLYLKYQDFEQDQIISIYQSLVRELTSTTKTSPTLTKEIYVTLGVLCCKNPKEMEIQHRNVRTYLMNTIEKQTKSSAGVTVDTTILEGCFKGLDYYLSAFFVTFVDDLPMKRKLYDILVKSCTHPNEMKERRLYRRTALHLFCHHCSLWNNQLLEDCQHWYLTIKEWTESFNSEDHKLGWKSMDAFLKVVGNLFKAGNQKHIKAYEFLQREFTSTIQANISRKATMLAVMGYGTLARATKLYKGEQSLIIMLEQLMSKIHQLFFVWKADALQQDDLVFYSTYIRAITLTMSQLEGSIPSEYLFDLEKVLFKLVQDFPHIPQKYQPFAIASFQDGAKYASLRTLLYQCLVHCCSFPVVTDSDDAGEEFVSSKSWLPFWHQITEDKHTNDAFMQGMIDIVQKLDFRLNTYEVIIDDDNGKLHESLESDDGSLTQVIKEESNLSLASSTTVIKERRPQKPKDRTILANLVTLFKVKPKDKSWQEKLLEVFIAQSTQSPDVSGFYRLIWLTLNEVQIKKNPDDHFLLFSTCLHYFEEVLIKCRQFEHELLYAVLTMFIKMPMVFVETLLDQLAYPMNKVFRSHQIPLISDAVTALENWTDRLGYEKTRRLLAKILPVMKNLLTSDNLDDTISKSKSKHKKIDIYCDPDLEKVQESILLFIGKLDSQLHGCLLPNPEELSALATAWNETFSIKVHLPFQDMHPGIFLDGLLPRLTKLCLHSQNRRTKCSACECLHVCMIYIIGDSAQHPQRDYGPLLKKLFPVILQLSSDEDSVVTNLFDKLLRQIIHWYTKASNHARPELIILLDCLMQGLQKEENQAVCLTSKKMLQEYLKWSIKQNPSARVTTVSEKLLLSRILDMWLDPIAKRREAGSMAFNSFYNIFREDSHLVNTYTIQLLVQAMHSIALDHPQVCEETTASIDHLVRIARVKRSLLSNNSSSAPLRKVPTEFTEGSKGCLEDFLLWLLESWLSSQVTVARHKSMEIIFALHANPQQLMEKSGLLPHFLSLINDPDQREESKTLEDILQRRRILLEKELMKYELAIWLCEQNISQVGLLQLEWNNYFSSNADDSTTSSVKYLRSLQCALVVKCFEWILLKEQMSITSEEQDLVITAIFTPSKLGFEIVHQKRLRDYTKKLSTHLSRKIVEEAFKKFFANVMEALRHSSSEVELSLLKEQIMGLQQVQTFVEQSNSCFESAEETFLLTSLKQHIETQYKDIWDELLELLVIYNLKFLGRCLTEHEIVKAYDNILFNACLNTVKNQHQQPPAMIIEEIVNSMNFPDLVRLLRFMASKIGDADQPTELAINQWVNFLILHWNNDDANEPKIVHQALINSKLTIHLVKYLSQIQPNRIMNEQSIHVWYCNLLANPSVAWEVKNEALGLLPVFLQKDAIDQALKKFVNLHFPLSAKELLENGCHQQFNNYSQSLDKFCGALEKTGSLAIFSLILNTTILEETHACYSRTLVALHNMHHRHALGCLEHAYDQMEDNKCLLSSIQKMRIMNMFVKPLLENTVPTFYELSRFFTPKLFSLLEIIAAKPKQHDKETILKKTMAYQLIGLLYSKASKDAVHSKASAITKRAYEWLNPQEDFNGKELSKFLVKQLKEVREITNRFETDSKEEELLLKELFREMQCQAYIAMMSILCSVQDQDKFFNAFLFSESQSVPLWSQIIDCDKLQRFSMLTRELPKTKEIVVPIKNILDGNAANEIGRKKKTLHFLADSSLSQDLMTSFDFNDSLVTAATQQGMPEEGDDDDSRKLGLDKSNVVEIEEEDDVGNHKCFAPLVALLKFMRSKGIIDDKSLSLSLSSLLAKIRPENIKSTPANVRIYILKLILTCSEIFVPFINDLAMALLAIILSKDTWMQENDQGCIVNYLSCDTIAFLLEHFQPPQGSSNNRTSMLSMQIRQCFTLLSEAAAKIYNDRRDVMRYLLNLCNDMTIKWKQFLDFNDLKLEKLFVEDDKTRNLVGIHVLGYLLSNDLSPASSPRLFTKVGMTLQCHKKEVFKATAEVMGLYLDHLERHAREDFVLALDIFSKQLRQLNGTPGARSQEKFMHCLYLCHTAYPKISSHFASIFVYSLQKIKQPLLRGQGVELLRGATTYLQEKISQGGSWNQEINMTRILDFLADNRFEEVQLAALDVLEEWLKLIVKVEKSLVQRILGHLRKLIGHKNEALRKKLFRILEWMQVAEVPNVQDILFLGLQDPDRSISSSIVDFIEETYLSKEVGTCQKLSFLFSKVSQATQDSFVNICCDMVLRSTDQSPQLKSLLFTDPLDKNTTFHKLNIDTSWRSQFGIDVMAPKFAQTLKSSLSTMSSSQSSFSNADFQVRGTQHQTLEFTPTQAQPQDLSMSSTSRTFRTSITQQSLRSNDPTFGQTMMDDHSIIGSPMQQQTSSAGPLRKARLGVPRFVSKDESSLARDFEKSKAFFARMHYKRQSRRDMLAKERIGQKQAQVNLQRQYRAGELPDVQITKLDVINPLKFLCYSDDVIAKQLLVEIVTQVLEEEPNEDRKEQLANLVLSTKPRKEDRCLAMAILEIGLKISGKPLLNLDSDSISTLSSTHRLRKYGVLLLEQKTSADQGHDHSTSKRGRRDDDEQSFSPKDVLNLMKLYSNFDKLSARGIYMQETANLSLSVLKGLQYESLDKYEAAMEVYKTIKSQDSMWNDAYLTSLQHLCAWSEFDDRILTSVEENKHYPKEFLNMHFAALFCLDDHHENHFNDVLEKSLNNIYIREDFAHEIGLLFRVLKKPDQAMNWHRRALKNLRKEWIESDACNSLDVQSTMDLIHRCKRISNAMMSKAPPLNHLRHQLDESQPIHLNDRLISEWKVLYPEESKMKNLSALYEELCLMCHHWSHHYAARRFLKYIDGGSGNHSSQYHQIRFVISKCLTLSNGNKGLNALYRQWMSLENNEKFLSLSTVDQKKLKAKILKALDILLKQREQSSIPQILGTEKYAHLQKLWKTADGSENLELHSVQLLLSIQVDLSLEERHSLLESCYTLIDQQGRKSRQGISDKWSHLVRTTFDLHCQLISQHECSKAMKMFPKIILLMELASSNEELQQSFATSLIPLKAWTLIPWANQLMSLLHDPTLKALIYPLVMKLAKSYPQTLWLAYNFLSEEIKEEYLLLQSHLKLPHCVQEFLEALKNVTCPEVLLKDFLRSIGDKSVEERRRLWEKFKALHVSVKSNVKRLFFHASRINSVQEIINAKTFTSEDVKKKIEDVCQSKTRDVYKLEDFSSFFGNHRQHIDKIEIPGQYGLSYSDPAKTKFVSIAGFKSQATVFASLRKPVKITMIGDDGRNYHFIVKSGEDLRQDQRVQQVFRFCNFVCKSELVNYTVIPIFDSLGIIEFLPKTRTLGQAIRQTTVTGNQPVPKMRPDLCITSPASLLKSFGRKMGDDFEEMIQLDHQGGRQLRQTYVNLSQSYEGFYYLRSNFMKSHAEVCLIGYILGIGDRHAQNMLISLESGKSVAIDFGYSFDAKFALAIPELSPFRFTPQIQGVMYPFKCQGIFKETMDRFLQQLCIHRDTLLSLLSVFIKEPTLDWVKDSDKKGTHLEEFAQHRISIVKRKLAQDNPAKLTLELLKNMANQKLIKGLENLLALHMMKKEEEEENDVVKTLIAMATDPEILTRSYSGWSPHL